MSTELASDLAVLSARLATEAGNAAATGRRNDLEADDPTAAMGATVKSSATDMVTRHDRAAEELIVEGITAVRPDDSIIGEEGTSRVGTSGVSWAIDPIDGTTNFLYGHPLWSTSVAALDGDGALAGAIYAPMLGQLYVAQRGGGATCNGAPIRPSGEQHLALALVGTGFGYDPEQRLRQAGTVATLLGSVRDLRRGGSAAIDLAMVAAGQLDVYYEERLNLWDMAAGELIAREAGCRTSDFSGGPPRPDELIVAAPGVYDAAIDLVRRSRAAADKL